MCNSPYLNQSTPGYGSRTWTRILTKLCSLQLLFPASDSVTPKQDGDIITSGSENQFTLDQEGYKKDVNMIQNHIPESWLFYYYRFFAALTKSNIFNILLDRQQSGWQAVRHTLPNQNINECHAERIQFATLIAKKCVTIGRPIFRGYDKERLAKESVKCIKDRLPTRLIIFFQPFEKVVLLLY